MEGSGPVDQIADVAPGDDGEAKEKAPIPAKALAGIALGALGIVFGDIGTSPLYTLKTILSDAGGHPDRGTTLGVLSLIMWTLVMVTTIKYVIVAMRIDNGGEGGILALMSLIGMKRGHRPVIIAAGLFGAALLYGDGAITPAISVLSALEGLPLAIPTSQILRAARGGRACWSSCFWLSRSAPRGSAWRSVRLCWSGSPSSSSSA